MIIYLYGKDSYRRNEKLRSLIGEYKEKHPQTDLFFADFGDEPGNLPKIKEFLNQPSMFADSKVAVIKEIGSVPDEDVKELLRVLKSKINEPKTFILISSGVPSKKNFSFLLEKPVKNQEFVELEGGRLNFFLSREAEKRGLVFSSEAFDFFLDYLEAQEERTWVLINALDELALARFKSPISLADTLALINWQREEEVYLLSRQILQARDRKRKLAFLESLFLQKEEPAYIFNSLAFQAAGENALKLADCDIAIKSGGMDYEEALTGFALD